jgi:ATP-dependent Clp protease adaptor protein ClpS
MVPATRGPVVFERSGFGKFIQHAVPLMSAAQDFNRIAPPRAKSNRSFTFWPNPRLKSAFYSPKFFSMPQAEPLVLPSRREQEKSATRESLEPGYLVICWNDPVNLMDYVTHVFQVVFGWTREKAEQHMLQVHHNGKSVLTRDSMEKAEHYVHQLQRYSLHATMEKE